MRWLLPFIIASFCFASCKKEFERPSWETGIAAPIASSTLSLKNLSFPDSVFSLDESNDISSLVVREKVYSYTLDSLVPINIPSFHQVKTLQSLVLSSDTVIYSMTLGELARQMRDNGDATGQFILDHHGKPETIIPVSGLTAGPFEINVTDFFQTATILEGDVSITIENGLPIDINDLQMELVNQSSGDLILTEQFTNISRESSQTRSQELDGKTIEGILNLSITNMNTGGGYRVIDTNDAISAILTISNVSVESATAVFPDQNVIDEKANTELEGMGDIELTRAILRSGTLDINISTSATDTIYYTYRIPAATKNGVPFEYSSLVPPSGSSGTSVVTQSFDFTGYEMDLTGLNGDKVNAIYNEFFASIQSGSIVSLSLEDFIDAEVAFNNIKPRYVEGYLGRDTILIGPETVPFTVFDDLQVNRLEFGSLDGSLEIVNSLGTDGFIDIQNITSRNTSSSITLTNAGSGAIPSAINSSPIIPGNALIPVTGNSPAPVELINIQPDEIEFQGMVVINPGQNDNNRGDFAYENGAVELFLNLDLPLNLIAEKLNLRDTSELTLNTSASDENRIKEGEFTLLAENQFPFDANLKVLFLNKNGKAIDSLVNGKAIDAGKVDLASGRVKNKSSSKISWFLSRNDIETISRAGYVVFIADFNTLPANQHVKIYSDYTLDLKIVGDFTYLVE